MSGRKCGNCRHYEPSPIWRSGWCRNPRLYGPQESHLVRQEELACAHRIGNYWEPIEDDAADGPGDERGIIGGLIKPLRLFGPGPRLVAAASGPPGSGRFGSGGGGAGGSDAGGSGSLGSSGLGRDRDAFGGGGGAAGGGGRPPLRSSGGPGRPDRTGRLPGQERMVSYQPEERYWTDYLRIALPVVGLLLMLGLFWFWAANLIGDDDNNDPPATVGAINNPTATETTVAAGNPTTAPTEPPAAETEPPPAETEAPPAETEAPPAETEAPPDEGSRFPIGSTVIVNDENVNFRPEPNTASTAHRFLEPGEELEVTGEIVTDDQGQEWLQVVDLSGVEGYVATNYVDPA